MVTGGIAALQFAGRTARLRTALAAQGRAILGQRGLDEDHWRTALLRLAGALVIAVAVPAVHADQVAVDQALEHEIVALVVAHTDVAIDQSRAQLAAEAAVDHAAIAERQMVHQALAGHVAAAGQGGGGYRGQGLGIQPGQRRRTLTGARILAERAGPLQGIACRDQASSVPQRLGGVGTERAAGLRPAQGGDLI